MKKHFVIVALLCAAQFTHAQNPDYLSLMNRKKKSSFSNSRVSGQQNQANRHNTISYGVSIGQTSYDLQSNHGAGTSRILKYPDGTITTVWAQSLDLNGNHPDRGTGYAVYDPTSQQWENIVMGWHGINTTRTGWPQILQVPNGELTIQHDYGASRIITNQRDTLGQGFWGLSMGYNLDAVWPRAVAVGDTIHMISIDNQTSGINGIEKPLEYHRSDDGGQSWAIQKYSNFPNYSDTTFRFGELEGDAYAIDAYGNHVAFVVGGGWDPVVLYKSDNFGAPGSWSKTIIFSPDTGYGYTDWINNQYIVPTLSSELSIVIDKTGKAHVATTGFAVGWSFGEDKPQNTLGERYYYPLASLGIYHWSEGMGTADYVYNEFLDQNMPSGNVLIPISHFHDYSGDGIYNVPADIDSIGAYFGGLAGHTSISVDQDSGVYIVWSQVAEITIPLLQKVYRDLYFAYSFDGGRSWNGAVNIASLEVADDGFTGGTISEEDVFPSTIRRVDADDRLDMIFQTDINAGMHVQGDLHGIGHSDIVYYPIDISYFRNINRLENKPNLDNQITVYPNPGRGKFHFKLDDEQTFDHIRVMNLVGSTLMEQKLPFNEKTIDISHLQNGIYLIQFQKQGHSVTKKIIKH